MKIAIITSRFNHKITQTLEKDCVERLIELGIEKNNIETFSVPGAVELPYAAKKLALSKKYSAIIILGVVIQGETQHFDYVCQQASYGCQKVMLEENIPVVFGVLTTPNRELAMQRADGRHSRKGYEMAEVAVEMASWPNR